MISFLIASYDNGRFIEVALESLRAQTVGEWEAIIVDDASSDDTLDRVSPYMEDSRFRLVEHRSNLGVGATLLTGLKHSSAPFFARLDPDDALEPHAVETMLRVCMGNPERSLIYSTNYQCDAALNPLRVPDWVGPVRTIHLRDDGIAHLAVFNRERYDKTEGFDTAQAKAVDWDVYYKMEEVGPTLFVPEPLYRYRRHDGGLSQGDQLPIARLYHARAVLRAYERRRDRGLPNLSRRETAARLYELAYTGLVADREWALSFLSVALRLDPTRLGMWKTYIGRRWLDPRRPIR